MTLKKQSTTNKKRHYEGGDLCRLLLCLPVNNFADKAELMLAACWLACLFEVSFSGKPTTNTTCTMDAQAIFKPKQTDGNELLLRLARTASKQRRKQKQTNS